MEIKKTSYVIPKFYQIYNFQVTFLGFLFSFTILRFPNYVPTGLLKLSFRSNRVQKAKTSVYEIHFNFTYFANLNGL